MANEIITISVKLTDAEALAYAEFLKRVGHSDYMQDASNAEEAYGMYFAGEKIRAALAQAGYAPR